jgi:transcriptional regulator with XRE-family HTH domain
MIRVSARTIQRIERGHRASAESLKAIAAVFDVDFSALREPDMQPPATSQISPEEALALAHVRRIKRFYMHLAEYCGIIALLAVMNVYLPALSVGDLRGGPVGLLCACRRPARVRQGALPHRPVGKAAGREISWAAAVIRDAYAEATRAQLKGQRDVTTARISHTTISGRCGSEAAI